ncbi:putative mitogen-activated protein kinase kinase kinase STE-STE11 family [Helianthus anomalus]
MRTFGHTGGGTPNWVRRNCIGKGSFGVVHLAVNESDDGFTFAVKSVEQNSTEFVRCLENEIEILKSLSSPYVVQYIGDDTTCESSSVYRNLHMEYLPNGTLADVAKVNLTGEEESQICLGCYNENIRSYTRCLTSALSYIHARNVVHCDVKGANMLIGDTPDTAKLADFGSAIKFGVPFPGTRGTPQWMAPEVIRGEYVGPESDVWSLGCTVIEMLTGKPPWPDRGADTLRQIGYSNDVPEFPTRVPDDLHDFLNKCIKRNPSERWSCDQLLRHPFLLACSSHSPPQITINDCKLSPRCVFDFPDSNSSNESTVENYQPHINTSTAKQRIGKLASNTRVNWDSEGWETVRHVTEELTETTSECWEDAESGASYDYDVESTSYNARGTMVGEVYRDSVDKYTCNIFVWIGKMFSIFVLINSNVIRHIQYTQWVNFNAKSSFEFEFKFKIFERMGSDLFTWFAKYKRVIILIILNASLIQ